VVALDITPGKAERQIWKTKVLEDAKPTRKNTAGTQMFGPAGAAIWSQPAIDAKRGQLYVATGDSYTEVPSNRSDSVVAMDLATGKIKWHTQVTANDNFMVGCGGARSGLNCPLGELGPDYDFGSSPILREVGGKGIVLAGQKSGIAYGFDAATGKKLWETKVGAGSALGGIEWGMAADDKALYAGVADLGVAADKAKQGLFAIDIKTGKVIWNTPAPKVACKFAGRCSNGHSAPPSASPGLVFAGAQDGHLRAFLAKGGAIVWDFDTAGQTYKTTNGVAEQKGGSIDGVGPVIAGDSMYAMSGFSGASGVGSLPVSVLLAFSIDGK
jgi:polyvinyl alcohol dehydrogenase (cytochrome)